ncbi:sensor domain-containing diguanylate cyclase [Pseudidiomarina insulisalsae]|uniref:sensor domain-containing diguanylate cyclase n=1 Tax=Pseudidiomarina insulisalsae TaxID=575789 RepID=UPI0018E53ADF|nr:sensor domain-containing diguanylate cyclase [Pseudidiomarina insulisalsae]
MAALPAGNVSDKLTQVFAGIGFGAVAALINYFLAFELYGSVTILLGQTFVFLALFTRGLLAALVSTFIAAIAVYLYTYNSFFFVTLAAEVIVVWFLYQRRVPILMADLIYWLVIGAPLSYAYLPTIIDVPQSFLILVLAKLLLNGLLYTALAILLYQLVPKSWRNVAMKPVSDSLRGRVFYLSFLCIIISSLSFSLLYTVRSAQQVEQQIVSDIGAKANSLRQVSEDFVNNYVVAVHNLRDSMLVVQDFDQKIKLMEVTQQNHPGFISMLLANDEGQIVHGVPAAQFAVLQNNPAVNRDISDRPYYFTPKANGLGYVSSAFRGRGFGTQPIIAISEPLMVNGEFRGIIEGSLNVPELSVLVHRTDIDANYQSVIVTDDKHQVIFATPELNLRSLSTYEPVLLPNLYTQDLPLTRIESRDLLYTQRLNSYGWHVYVFSSPHIITQLFLDNLIILLLFLALIALLFAFVTRRFAQDLNRPLEQLAKQLRHNTETPLAVERGEMTREVRTIADNLIAARKVMVDFNRQLQQQVNEKTADLERLNLKLQKLAREDGLTELLNRRTFDDLAEQRYHEAMATREPIALILMDIDHFKRINDTMGHPVGDECIQCVGALIKEHFERRGCLCGRYGGEEFALFVSASENVLELVEEFQNKLATYCEVNGQVIPVTISMGIAEVRHNFSGGSFRRLVAQADKLLYQSKDNGRNRISLETI